MIYSPIFIFLDFIIHRLVFNEFLETKTNNFERASIKIGLLGINESFQFDPKILDSIILNIWHFFNLNKVVFLKVFNIGIVNE